MPNPSSTASPKSQDGFTLVELMVVLAIAAILLAIGVPSFQSFIARARVDAAANELQSALQLARSEAARRSGTVTIALLGTAGTRNWTTGWRVFVDTNANGMFDAGDEEVRVFPAIQTPLTVMSSAGAATSLSFDGRGRVTPAAANTFAVCFDNDLSNARAILVSPGGRVRRALDTNGNRIPNRDDGADIASCNNP